MAKFIKRKFFSVTHKSFYLHLLCLLLFNQPFSKACCALIFYYCPMSMTDFTFDFVIEQCIYLNSFRITWSTWMTFLFWTCTSTVAGFTNLFSSYSDIFCDTTFFETFIKRQFDISKQVLSIKHVLNRRLKFAFALLISIISPWLWTVKVFCCIIVVIFSFLLLPFPSFLLDLFPFLLLIIINFTFLWIVIEINEVVICFTWVFITQNFIC